MSYSTEDERWQAILDRDHAAEGSFWFGVSKTMVFCRPGCPTRTPQRTRVHYFDTLVHALLSGYSPCPVCKPLGETLKAKQTDAIVRTCREITVQVYPKTLEELAHNANLSPDEFEKLFTGAVGVDPEEYGRIVLLRRMCSVIPPIAPVDQSPGDAGPKKGCKRDDDAKARQGMTVKTLRSEGESERIRFAIVETWLGQMLIVATDKGICRIAFGDDAASMEAVFEREFAKAIVLPSDDAFDALVARTVELLGTPEMATLPLDIRGTAFQEKVWRALRRIPFGQAVSYADLAEDIGQPTAVRAVATACARNRIAVAIPCHRVIGKDGRMAGYAWGVDRKRALLAKERT